MLSNPLLLGAVVAVVAGLAASFFVGLWRGGRNEVSAGLDALCGMKWRDYAHLIEDLLRERGYARSGEERRPGDGGFDLLMTRGTSRYLVECKNGAAHRVTERSVNDLGRLVELHGAEGAVLATTGRVDPAALTHAANRRVEVIAGADLWRQVKAWVPHDLREEAEAQARGGFARALGLTLAVAILAGAATVLLVPALQPNSAEALTSAPPRPAATASAARTPSAAPAPVRREPAPTNAASNVTAANADAAPAAPVAMPDPNLSEEQLNARRASASMEARGNPAYYNVVWATKSTVVVTLRQPGAAITDDMFDEVCRILTQYEELRFTRLQIESPSTEPGGTPAVRYRQCR